MADPVAIADVRRGVGPAAGWVRVCPPVPATAVLLASPPDAADAGVWRVRRPAAPEGP